jgi:hypothetical protein
MPGFPTLTELLDYLAFLGEEPAALGALATATLLVVLHDWRWSLLALAVQYVLVGWLFTQVLEPQLAVLKILVGLLICLVLYLTARQVGWSERQAYPRQTGSRASRASGRRRWRRIRVPARRWFPLLISGLTSIAILYASGSGLVSVPQVPPLISRAAVSLVAMGLLAMGLTEEPLRAGMGLLTFMAGFELLYHSLEQAITVIGFVVGIDLLVATVIAHLTVARHLTSPRPEPGQDT